MSAKASITSASPPQYDGDYVRTHVFVDDVKKDGRALKTKFGVAHGCRGASAELARFAADALLRGEVDKLVFSGGNVVRDILTFGGLAQMTIVDKDKGLGQKLGAVFDRARDCFAMQSILHFYTEAEYMKKVALEHIRKQIPDFDENRIIIENQHAGVRPTSSNVADGVGQLLRNETLREEILKAGAVMVMQHAYNTRLAASAWQAKLPEHMIIVPKSSYPYGRDEYNWEGTPLESLVYMDATKVDPKNPKGNFQRFPENFQYYDAEEHAEKARQSLDMVDLA